MTALRDKLRPPRTRFAPTPPESGGAFLHIGHVAMLLEARRLALEKGIAFDVRFDAAPDVAGLLDTWNCLNWFGIVPRRVYVLEMVNETQIANFGSGDSSRFSSFQLSAHFDDVLVENQTTIIRGNEFADEVASAQYDALDAFWGKARVEFNTPLVLRGSRKMSKSDGDNAIHWGVLKDFEADKVRGFLLDKMRANKNWEWNWEEFLRGVRA